MDAVGVVVAGVAAWTGWGIAFLGPFSAARFMAGLGIIGIAFIALGWCLRGLVS